MTKHRDLANSEHHEDKGVAAASDREMYFADGSGSGEWKPLIYTTSSALSGASVEFTGLGEFAFVQVDLFNVQKNTSTDHPILCQLGNNSGYTTSSSYYSDFWESAADTTLLNTGIYAGFFSEDTGLVNNGINCTTVFIGNFNQSRYTIWSAGQHMPGTTFTTNQVGDFVGFVREQKAYNKLRLVDTIGAQFTGGTIVVSGWRYYTS